MGSSRHQPILFLLVITILYSSAICKAVLARCIQEHHDSLLLVRNGINVTDSSDQFLSWERGTDCCEWAGVSCGGKGSLPGHVTGLGLSSSYLSGNVHPALFNLTSLQNLTLPANLFQNTKFPSLGLEKLKSLTKLDLSFYDTNTNCSLDGRVLVSASRLANLEILSLESCSLSGEAPVENLRHLRRLKELNLGSCGLSGPIPVSIGELTQLSLLDLSANNLSGTIPESLASLTRLTGLSLSFNSLSGPLPTFIGNLTQLETLELNYNNFTGAIPMSLFNHPTLMIINLSKNRKLEFQGESSSNTSSALTSLILSDNQLQGMIPNILLTLTHLRVLSLDGNNLTVDVCKSSFKRLTDLSDLSISGNFLNSDRCDSDFLPASIQYLLLASCNLTNFPKFLKGKNELLSVDLYRNRIEGLVPDWAWNIPGLNLSFNLLTGFEGNIPKPVDCTWDKIDLRSNRFQGPIPLSANSSYIDYSDNNFTGSIPTDIGLYMNKTEIFAVSKNMLVGEIPRSICQATFLVLLDLSHNKLTGSLPSCLFNMPQLTTLNLLGNRFSGRIPVEYNTICRLEVLNLNGNVLQGGVPSGLSNCKNLKFLDIGNNELVDKFPFWLTDLNELIVLSLRNNRFHGSLPKIWNDTFSKLQIMDLSLNQFAGSLPPALFQSLRAIKTYNYSAIDTSLTTSDTFLAEYHDSITISAKGREAQLVKTLTLYNSLDLSSNSFEGDIPEEIGELKYLKVLNLSRNHLAGNMPRSLGRLAQIESMDLSWNQIQGKIPMELTSLNFLAVLNLSYNRFEGAIPQGPQFSTFQWYSYIGNEHLCGDPSPVKCNKEDHVQPSESNEKSSKDLDWSLISMEAGFILGITLCYACLIFSVKTRAWFNVIIYHVQTSIPCVSISSQ